ncbi:hypothetical protein D9758_009993 [Tetrapyrgos nigripes]|uniref:Uncharacterized protein n=1 Tax=Tetrapyrgos nigripes TaxID=182062 RepID=A0A8H5CU51_9AGAR|nr:hypothetical protein D9758_009993 [Tetrapyrgos nigripes]
MSSYIATASLHVNPNPLTSSLASSPIPAQDERKVEEKEIPQTQAQAQKDESPFQVNDLTRC